MRSILLLCLLSLVGCSKEPARTADQAEYDRVAKLFKDRPVNMSVTVNHYEPGHLYGAACTVQIDSMRGRGGTMFFPDADGCTWFLFAVKNMTEVNGEEP